MEENFKVPIIGPKRPEPETTDEKVKSEDFLCPYKVPSYNGILPDRSYSFEVLKNGSIVEEIKNLDEKPYHVIGRLPLPHVDINSAHPTSSRFHCVLQYRPSMCDDELNTVDEGWYVYDLDSTHGTFINKYRIKPKTYVRMRVGHQLKLGNSSRCYILQGPLADEEDISEFSITELKQQRQEKENEKIQNEIKDKSERESVEKAKEEEGISWGMQDDAEEEPDLTENPFAVTNNEELFINDPKKTLRGFFEREGHDLDYRCDELSPGVFICRVELPIDDEFGKPLVCEVQNKGKKKECVVQCALEACRILDRHGVLRQANHEPRRKRKVSESDSDDDNFFDRTGDVEKKRLKKQGQVETEVLTYDQLTLQEQEILVKIQENEMKLDEMIQFEKQQKSQQTDDDDLDSFMLHLSDQKVDKFEIRNKKNELQNLKMELVKIQKLINIAKPSVVLPSISQSKSKLPLFGKRSRLPKDFGIKKPAETAKKAENEFEVENDDDEEMEMKKEARKVILEPSSTEVEVKKVEKQPEIEKKVTENVEKQPEVEIKVTEKVETETAAASITDVKLDKNVVEETAKVQVETITAEIADDKKPEQPAKPAPTKKSRKPLKTYKLQDRYRAHIDMNDDDEYIDEEKVSMWLPPHNQTGDGTSHLNDKFGY